jgi:hypothetical protein
VQYLPDQSQPPDGPFAFAYTVTIRNTGDVTAQLVARQWLIIDAHGRRRRVVLEGAAREHGPPDDEDQDPQGGQASMMINHMVCSMGGAAAGSLAILGALADSAACSCRPAGAGPGGTARRGAASENLAAAAPCRRLRRPLHPPRRRRWPRAPSAAPERPAAARGRAGWPPPGSTCPAGRRPRRRGCGRRCRPAARGPAPGWSEACARALLDPPAGHEAAPLADGAPAALARGEPPTAAPKAWPPATSSRPRGPAPPARQRFRVPLYAPPPELAHAARKPYFTRQQLDTLPAAMASAARPRDRLDRGPAGRAAAAGAGLGPAALHRARWPRQHRAPGLRRRTTSSPTARSAAG